MDNISTPTLPIEEDDAIQQLKSLIETPTLYQLDEEALSKLIDRAGWKLAPGGNRHQIDRIINLLESKKTTDNTQAAKIRRIIGRLKQA